MCGVTRAPFNSNRSSCGIEVVVPFFFYPNSNTLRCVPFQYTGFIDVFGANESRRRVNRAVPCTLAIEVRVASVEGHDALAVVAMVHEPPARISPVRRLSIRNTTRTEMPPL